MIRVLFLSLPLTLAGCAAKDDSDGDPTDLEPPSGCETVGAGNCLYPFPSDRFLAEDTTTVTGFRVQLPADAMPEMSDGTDTDPKYWNEKDGWSINAQPTTWFDGMSDAGLIPWTDIGAFEGSDVKTVIIDTTTGERVPHWAELDLTVLKPEQAPLMLRPAMPLRWNHHYIVGIRGLVKTAGGPVDVAEDFLALRDGTSTTKADVEDRRKHFDDVIFPALEAEGFARGDLQIAWDFTTESRENTLGKMLWMRDDALARVGTAGPTWDITQVDEGNCEGGDHIARTIYGTLNAPMYTLKDGPPTFLTRGEDGMPFYNGEAKPKFMVRIPCSLATDPKPGAVLHYGHGLLGDLGEARAGYLAEIADAQGWVIFAMDWAGMSAADAGHISYIAASAPGDFAFVPERTQQGFVQKLVGLRMITGDFADDDLMTYPDSEGNEVSVVDKTTRYYYGNSQGAILGGAYLALSTDIERGVLGVGGGPYAVLLTRSHDFTPFFKIFQAKFSDGRDISLLVNNMMQHLWDPGESAGYGYELSEDPLPGTEPHQVLMQTALGDAQVSQLGARVMARAYKAQAVAPVAESNAWGVEAAVAPFVGNAFVEWDYTDVEPIPFLAVPPSNEPDPHECPRREPAAQQQLVEFLKTGTVQTFCDGVCTGSTAVTCP